METFKEGVKMKADVHTLSLLLEAIPNIFCSIPFFGMIKLHPNYAFVVCLLFIDSKDRDYKFISLSNRLF